MVLHQEVERVEFTHPKLGRRVEVKTACGHWLPHEHGRHGMAVDRVTKQGADCPACGSAAK